MFAVGEGVDKRFLNELTNEKVEYLARWLARDAGQIRNPLDEKEFLKLPTDVQYVCRKMAVEYADILIPNWEGREDGEEQPGEERSEPGPVGLGEVPGE